MMTLNGTYLTQFSNPSYYKLQSLLLFSRQKPSWNFESWVVWKFWKCYHNILFSVFVCHFVDVWQL